ncbi:unnamed protein product [Eruca vesicaria subsp. sativa]|uniref:Uncharacterized protein n=1 Tax=Eruca vesicaria subsp. sativa TaxID=29727 RepID=A0ABC8JQ47_ERUVS|nr:unnamed protein product [Eruca vesicaria subsp. sativa]CAH8334857.1 unnamed protein product [Eruca vesicaria subsp. sativa]
MPRRFVVVGSCSWRQLTKSLMKRKPTFSYPSHSHHFLSHVLPFGHASSSSEIHGFFTSTLRNTHLKLKPGSLLESRAGFLDPQLLPKPCVFTGFQKRRWYLLYTTELGF